MYVCMSVCMYVCMYVCTYLLKYRYVFEYSNIFWILHSLCGTEPIHRHKRRHVSFAISFYFLLLPFLASAKSCICFQPHLGTRVCFDSARTVHAQCTATVHGLETLQIPQKVAPRLQNKEKTCFRIFYLISCHFNR